MRVFRVSCPRVYNPAGMIGTDAFRHDLKGALRGLWTSPGFAALHLATPEALAEPPALLTMVTREARFRDNARALGYLVEVDGRGRGRGRGRGGESGRGRGGGGDRL